MLALFVAAGRSTGTRPPVVVEVVLHELAGRDRRARLRALGREQLDDLRRMDGPAPARRHDPRCALVEDAQRLLGRIVDLHHHAAAGGAEEAQHAVALGAVLADAHADAQLDELEPQLAAEPRVPGDDGARLLGVELRRRPRVEHQPVPARPLARRAARLVRAHRLERLARHPLELRERGDAAVGVEHGRQVAHLGDGDEPLVALVLARGGAEQVDVGRRREPLEREVRQPPEVQPLGHHRVQPAVVGVLGERTAAGGAREAGQLDPVLPVLGVDRREHDARDGVGERGVREQRLEPGALLAPGVEVGEHPLALGERARVAGQRGERAREVVRLHPGGGEVMAHVLVHVGRGEERQPVELRLREPLERADAEVAPRHRLHERLAGGGAGVGAAAREQRGERLLAADERAHVALALLVVRDVRQRAQVRVHLRVGLLARGLDERAVERRPAQLARQLGQRGLASGERVLQAVEHRAVAVVGPVGALVRALEVARQHGLHDAPGGARAQLADEQPVARRLQRRGALEPADAVVRERAFQRRDEAVRQPLRGRVERAQERVQPLLRAAEALVVGVRPVERADVRVGLKQRALAVGVHRRPGQPARDRRDVALVDVVAEHEPEQALQVGRPVVAGRLERDPARVVAAAAVVLDRVDLDQRPAGRDVHVDRDEYLAHAAVDRRGQRGLHLHRLRDHDDVARLHLVALGDGDGDDDGGRVRTDEAALVARDAVRHAVDLDEQVGVLHRGDRAVGAAAVDEPRLVLGDALELHLDAGAVDVDLVAARAELADAERVARALVAQVDRLAHLGLGVRAAAAREGVELRPVGRRRGVAQRDRRAQQRRVRVAGGLDVARALQAVQPARVDVARPDLGAAQQLEQEALVGRALLDHHHRVGERPAQPRDRLGARRAVGDDLRDHRVEVGRHRVALRHARVDAHARAAGQPQQGDAPGRGRERAPGVLRVQPRLDRVAARRRRIALEPPAGGDVELELDEVGARDGLGDRVLDLQPGVDLHEREAGALGLVEELDGARAAVAGALREARRRLGDLALLLGAERRARGLLDDLLVPALVAAVADAERPHGAVPVGHQLHLDVARDRHDALHQHRRVAEALRGLLAGALERGRKVLGALDAPHAAPAAAGRGLDHQRVADRLAVADRRVGVLDRTAAPRRDRHAGLLGELLRLDLVAQRAHHVGVRPGEDDLQALAQLGELRVLGDEPPADPGGVGARLHERALERGVVEVGAAAPPVRVGPRGGAEAVRLVGLADEQGVALGLGIEGDQADRVRALLVELADGVDRTHRRLAAVDDREPLERALHRRHPLASMSSSIASSRSSASRSASGSVSASA